MDWQLYFGGRLVQSQGKWLVTDRVGSVVADSTGRQYRYYPYGEERPGATAQGTQKFGTYFRDLTGLDYAQQRYYDSGRGRFMSADPGPTNLRKPQSLNRYSYATNDPVNMFDPSGLMPLDPSICGTTPGSPLCIEAEPGIGTTAGNDWGPIYDSGFLSAYALLSSPPPIPSSPAGLTLSSLWRILAESALQGNSVRVANQQLARYASYIEAANDCYYPRGIGQFVGFTRVVTYQVYDQTGARWRGSEPPLTVAEHLLTYSGTVINQKTNGTTVWRRSDNSLSPFGTFTDWLTAQGASGVSTAAQVFWAEAPGMVTAALRVIFGGSAGYVLNNTYTNITVTINNSISPRPCGPGDPRP